MEPMDKASGLAQGGAWGRDHFLILVQTIQKKLARAALFTQHPSVRLA
jgi:hypothetical protein